MPTTPTLLLPYPAPTDPADVPTDMGELANQIEAVRGAANGLAALGSDGKVPAAQLPAGGSTVIPLVTTLPGSPTDGQEVILVDSLTAATYQWRLRYNAGATSPYKWEFVGGAALLTLETTQVAPTVAAGKTAVGPSPTAPRAGIYQMRYVSGLFSAGTAGTHRIIPNTFPGLADIGGYSLDFTMPATNVGVGCSSEQKVTIPTAGTSVVFAVQSLTQPVTTQNRQIALTPIRVS